MRHVHGAIKLFGVEMGYILNHLSNLPVDDKLNFYIFVVNGRYLDPLYEMIQANFVQIAREIGDDAVVAMGTDSKEFTTSVARKYLGEGNSDSSFIKILPALLITNNHPENLTADSLRLIVPLKHAEAHFGDWHQFFEALAQFVRGENDDFARKFEETGDLINASNKVVMLQPNFFGLGLNVNELIDRWRNRKHDSA